MSKKGNRKSDEFASLSKQFKDLNKIEKQLSRLQDIVDVKKRARKQSLRRVRTQTSFQLASIRGQLTRAYKIQDIHSREERISELLTRARKANDPYKNQNKGDIFVDELLNSAIEKSGSFVSRFGYHVAQGSDYAMEDLELQTFISTIKGNVKEENIGQVVQAYNEKISGTGLSQITENEVLKVISKL